jgi:uncharacterized protein YdhG (YjbR/CyaY superfamily)
MALREQIQKLVLGATEKISYQLPSLEIAGVMLLSYEGFKAHNSIFPGAEVIYELKKDLEKYKTSKGTIQFDLEKLPPLALIKEIVRTRIKLINASYQKKSGEFREF